MSKMATTSAINGPLPAIAQMELMLKMAMAVALKLTISALVRMLHMETMLEMVAPWQYCAASTSPGVHLLFFALDTCCVALSPRALRCCLRTCPGRLFSGRRLLGAAFVLVLAWVFSCAQIGSLLAPPLFWCLPVCFVGNGCLDDSPVFVGRGVFSAFPSEAYISHFLRCLSTLGVSGRTPLIRFLRTLRVSSQVSHGGIPPP